MNRRGFEQSMNPEEHIERDLKDAGISNPSEWREALASEELPGLQNFTKLFNYLEESKIPNRSKIEGFGVTKDALARLELLKDMSLTEAVESIKDFGLTPGAYWHLCGRLYFYQKLIEGKATTTYQGTEIIDASSVTPETVKRGLWRDVFFAAMTGTPEMAIHKISSRQCIEASIPTNHFPSVKGYDSGIDGGSIGSAYPFLREIYEKARASVEGRIRGQGREIGEQEKEHRAVMLASSWLTESMNYNDPGRSRYSPYFARGDEAIAWARLGEQVKKQFRGMRQKICGIDLQGVGRFIGKSGDDKYDPERKRLFGEIRFLKEGDDPAKKQEFVTKENGFAIKKQEQWYEKEIERLAKKSEKSKAEIERANFPEEEAALQLQSVLMRHKDAIARLRADYETQTARLRERTPEQLLADLEQRQTLVNTRHEKRKSLAQKALDLHFRFNHSKKNNEGEYHDGPYAGIIDWVNSAPFGTIKRSHRMLQRGISEETVVALVAADIICGARGVTREDFVEIKKFISGANDQGRQVQYKISAMMEMSRILSQFNYTVSVAELAKLADKNFNGMAEALKMYDLDQVRIFMDRGCTLLTVIDVRKITQKLGHDLPLEVIAEMASHNIYGLEDAFQHFDLDAIRTLLNMDAKLPAAIIIAKNAKQFSSVVSLEDIATISKTADGSFLRALELFPLAVVQEMQGKGVDLALYLNIKDILTRYKVEKSHDDLLSFESYLRRSNDRVESLEESIRKFGMSITEECMRKNLRLADVLVTTGIEDAFQHFDLDTVRTLLKQNVFFPVAISIAKNAKQFGYEVSLEEIVEISKKASTSFLEALELFPLAAVQEMQEKGVDLVVYFRIKDLFKSKGIEKSHDDLIFFESYLRRSNDRVESLEESIRKFGIGVTEQIVRNNVVLSYILRYPDIRGAFEYFDPDTVCKLLIQHVKLPFAIIISKNAKQFGYEVSLEDIATISKNADTLFLRALELFPLAAVQEMQWKGVELTRAIDVRKITQKLGHDLPLKAIAAMASHDISGLDEDAFQQFDLDAIRTLLNLDAQLPAAIIIAKNAKQFGYAVSLEDIAKISKTADTSFLRALGLFPLAEVEEMQGKGVNLARAIDTRNITKKFGHDLPLKTIIEIARYDIFGLEDALQHFDIDTIRTLLNLDAQLPAAIIIAKNAKQFSSAVSLEDIAKISKAADGSFLKALGLFPLAAVQEMQGKGVDLALYLNIKDILTRYKVE
ncbi:hypothetical protein HY625_01240, partial [Candidatus Uhrbacteria bacterium]|nr:hypothetical protein [Candidatus Uhrbacteria bacterium]